MNALDTTCMCGHPLRDHYRAGQCWHGRTATPYPASVDAERCACTSFTTPDDAAERAAAMGRHPAGRRTPPIDGLSDDDVKGLFNNIIRVQDPTLAPMCECRCATGTMVRHADRDCTRHASKLVRLHLVGGCNEPGELAAQTDPDGNVVVYMCGRCTLALRTSYDFSMRKRLAQLPADARPGCPTCGRPTRTVGDILGVEDIPR